MSDVVVVAELNGREVARAAVTGGMLFIGRDPALGLHLDDRALSRRHALVRVNHLGAIQIEDLQSQNGVYVNGLRIGGATNLEMGDRIEIGRYVLRFIAADDPVLFTPALDESTDPDDRAPPASSSSVRVEVIDRAALENAIGHVRVGRHFVFVDDAQAVMPPQGRKQRLLGYKQKKGRVVKALADAAVDIAGARIHPAAFETAPLASLTCDRDLYRAEEDVVRLLVAMPGRASNANANANGKVQLRVTMNNAPFTERDVEVERGIALETLAALLPGSYEARLVVDGKDVGEPVSFTVAQYTLAPLSARLVEHRLDRGAQTLAVTFDVETYAVPFDRTLRAMLVERGREMSEIALAPVPGRAGRFTGRARVVGDGPFRVRLSAVDDPARTAEVALPGTRRAERKLTLAGELGKELFVSLLPEAHALSVRGLFVTHGDFIATPIVVENPIGDRAVLKANEDVESLVVAAYDPAHDGWSVHDVGDLPRNGIAEIEVPKPMAIAFVGCFVKGEPFEAFTSLFAAEHPIAVEVPDVCEPGEEIGIRVKTNRAHSVPVYVCVRDERLTATDTAKNALAASTKRALESAAVGLGDDFAFAPLRDVVARVDDEVHEQQRGALEPLDASQGALRVRVTERGGVTRELSFTQNELTFGRVPGNDIVLGKPNVSKRHTRVVLRDGRVIAVDLKSTNGTFIGGKRLSSPQVLRAGDRIAIGDFLVEIVAVREATTNIAIGAPRPRHERAPRHRADDVLFSLGADDDVDDEGAPELLAEDAAADDDVITGNVRGIAEEPPSPPPSRAPAARRPSPRAMEPRDDEDVFDGAAEKPAAPAANGARASAPAPAKGRGDDEGAVANEPPLVRASFPEVLFCGVVDVADGDVIRVPAGDSLGAFAVEAFFVDDGDFGATEARVQIDKQVRVDVDIAPEIDPEDRVAGTLRAFARGADGAGGGVRVSLVRDGRAVSLRTGDGRVVASGDVLPSGSELVFDAGPGLWLASAEDPATGAIDSLEVRVGTPGVYRTVAREIVLLDKGKRIALDGDMLSLRVLPGIDEPFTMLAEATAGYTHLCCEQTAAKIVSAVVMFLTAADPVLKKRAEDIVLAGIAREQSMYRRGRGFSIYPETREISDHYTPLVVRHLWSLDGLADLHGLSPALVEAVRAGIAMADDIAHAHALRRVPERVESMDDAYAIALREPRRVRESLEHIARTVAVDENGARLKPSAHAPHRVAERAQLAYAAATLFAAGKAQTAMRIANEVLRSLNDQGRLYSTVDSVAAIALMVQLKKAGVVGGNARVVVNGRALGADEAAALSDQVEVVEVKDGVCVVEVTRAKEEVWADARAAFPLKVGLRDHVGKPLARVRRGDACELVVSLPKGYVEGDLVHVCLPPSLAWLQGGGRVKRFTCDFAGRDEVRVPVVVTHAIDGRQKFAVAVRNMFQEERASSPGLLVVEGA